MCRTLNANHIWSRLQHIIPSLQWKVELHQSSATPQLPPCTWSRQHLNSQSYDFLCLQMFLWVQPCCVWSVSRMDEKIMLLQNPIISRESQELLYAKMFWVFRIDIQQSAGEHWERRSAAVLLLRWAQSGVYRAGADVQIDDRSRCNASFLEWSWNEWRFPQNQSSF